MVSDIWQSNELPKILHLSSFSQKLVVQKTDLYGGESAIYKIIQPATQKYIAKIFKNSKVAEVKEPKINAMMKSLVDKLNDVYLNKYIKQSIAIPRLRLYDNRGRFVGFAMTSYLSKKNITLEQFIDNHYRLYNKHNSWIIKISVALNLIKACSVAHSLGMVLVDLNPRNILVKNNTDVVLIDIDSAQFKYGGKKFDFDAIFQTIISPEIIKNKGITKKTDSFALGILLFKIFMMGFSPFQYIAKDNEDDKDMYQIILSGASPLRDKKLKFPKSCPDISLIGPAVKYLARSLDPKPWRRPNLKKLNHAINKLINKTCFCKNDHPTPSYFKRCIVCGSKHKKRFGIKRVFLNETPFFEKMNTNIEL